jgi:hypothetical protein
MAASGHCVQSDGLFEEQFSQEYKHFVHDSCYGTNYKKVSIQGHWLIPNAMPSFLLTFVLQEMQ